MAIDQKSLKAFFPCTLSNRTLQELKKLIHLWKTNCTTPSTSGLFIEMKSKSKQIPGTVVYGNYSLSDQTSKVELFNIYFRSIY